MTKNSSSSLGSQHVELAKLRHAQVVGDLEGDEGMLFQEEHRVVLFADPLDGLEDEVDQHCRQTRQGPVGQRQARFPVLYQPCVRGGSLPASPTVPPGHTGAERSDDLVGERIDDKKPGNGLPQSPQNRLAGTHSGFATTLRVADANEEFFPEGSMLFQYEARFMFDAVTAELPAGLPRGQVIARGVAIFDSNFDPLKPLTFAVVGGQRPTGGERTGYSVWDRRQYPYAQDLVVTARDSHKSRLGFGRRSRGSGPLP